ncbi:tyrosine-protein kinase ITK/TSK-like [Xenopus laevis]|uniref:Tyrosine-protein kinase ITK/TSK-like n=1 Tax=Xenopus laevis TaxID=8355 RepID=A0A8J1MWW1_XENLA|nr:tyrosine-protein kinase ITK/TSK-like [Xenopus laevis]XP_041445490.1 tyrosine-protein kinase ITK/TSK-like [Xenopus laevis]XP_041445491.1 tyrosine-protein kinase ITK/TSK-like [Xenopus laevis]XP_041445492.1 tyrosine-protein kinase ITK/TSK-like [Xenopus laevis]XP_041445493.1 tyrosine-protein kinase ITK/TSK-like [Xenopus laevis]
MWSFGVLVWEMFSKSRKKSFQLEAVEKISAGLRLFKPKMSSERGYMQMNNGWQKDFNFACFRDFGSFHRFGSSASALPHFGCSGLQKWPQSSAMSRGAQLFP